MMTTFYRKNIFPVVFSIKNVRSSHSSHQNHHPHNFCFYCLQWGDSQKLCNSMKNITWHLFNPNHYIIMAVEYMRMVSRCIADFFSSFFLCHLMVDQFLFATTTVFTLLHFLDFPVCFVIIYLATNILLTITSFPIPHNVSPPF